MTGNNILYMLGGLSLGVGISRISVAEPLWAIALLASAILLIATACNENSK